MPLCKALLLSCIGMLCISFLASRPVELGNLQENMEALELPLCNLKKAEENYVTLVFNGNPPMNYCSKSLQPLEGLTYPVGNITEEEIQVSLCAISNYLINSLPMIMSELTQQPQDVIDNIEAFHVQFKAASSIASSCQNIGFDPTDHYSMKVFGLRIIYFARRWVEDFTGINPSCP